MATKFISYLGAGSKNGSSLANAIQGGVMANLTAAVEAASSGDIFKIVNDGEYITTNRLFLVSVPLEIQGIDAAGAALGAKIRTKLSGTNGTTYLVNSPDSYQNKGVEFAAGIDNITLTNIQIKLFQYGVFAENGRNRDITFNDCRIEKCCDDVAIHGDWHLISNNTTSTGSPASTFYSTAHGISNGEIINIGTRFVSAATNIIPGGVGEEQDYYVVNKTNDTFQISNTLGGSVVPVTSVGAGLIVHRRSTSAPNSQRWNFNSCELVNFARSGCRIRRGCSDIFFNTIDPRGDADPFIECTLDAATDTFTTVGDLPANNEAISFLFTTVPGGLSATTKWRIYFAKNVNTGAGTFQVSATEGGAVFNFSTNGSGIKWHRSYSTSVGQQQGGIDVGWTSGGKSTKDKNIVITNITGGHCSQKLYPDGNTWQGDGVKTEDGTSGSINGGTIEYCADGGIDCKGDWTIQNLVVVRNHQNLKSYAGAPERLVGKNLFIGQGVSNGGAQETRALSLYGYMDLYNCTIWGHTDASKMVKIIGLYHNDARLKLRDCIIGYFSDSSPNMTKELENSPSTPSLANPLIDRDSTVTWYNDENVPDTNGNLPVTNPQFVNPNDLSFLGGNTNWNSIVYGKNRGYFYEEVVEGGAPATAKVIGLKGVKMRGVIFK